MSISLPAWQFKQTDERSAKSSVWNHLAIGSIALLIGSVATFFLLKKFLFFHTNVHLLLVRYALLLVIAIAFSKIRTQEAPPPYQIVLRSCVLTFSLYSATYYYSLPITDPALGLLVGPLRWITVLCGLIAWFRPSFGLLLFLYTFWFKKMAMENSGYTISPTDYTAVNEIGLFLIIGLLLYSLGQKLRRFYHEKKRQAQPQVSTHNNTWQVLHVFLYLTIAVHFSNYFYSGLEKVLLNHSLTTWIFENHTEYLTLSAMEYGTLPISPILKAFPWIFLLIGHSIPLINFISLSSQFATIVALVRVRWMIALTILFDLFHVAIFLLSGIFFWKWIILNLSIVIGLRCFPRGPIPRPAIAGAIVCLLSAPFLFFVVRLGWFDTRAPISTKIEALTRSGEHIPAPSNYVLMPSVTFAQSRVARPLQGHFSTGAFGSTRDYQHMLTANACQLHSNATPQISDEGFSKFETFMRKHHQFVLAHLDKNGQFNYDLYPHHIWSNPLEFTRFHDLDKRQIVGYRLVVQSACLGFDGSHFTKDVKYRNEREFHL
jgi:hypothetical protein